MFIDRDGVINEDKSYVYKTEDLVILPRVAEGLKLLKDSGFLLIVLTNQSGIARGYFNLDDVHSFHNEINQRLEKSVGVTIDDFFICPHHTKGSVDEFVIDCKCRKPKTGMVDDALEKWNIDLENSFMIGDKKSDIGLAKNLKIPGFQINNGMYEMHPDPEYTVKSLYEAAKILTS